MLDILRATEGSLASVACLGPDADVCPREGMCKTLPMWKKFDAAVDEFFGSITIDDLVKGNV